MISCVVVYSLRLNNNSYLATGLIYVHMQSKLLLGAVVVAVSLLFAVLCLHDIIDGFRKIGYVCDLFID